MGIFQITNLSQSSPESYDKQAAKSNKGKTSVIHPDLSHLLIKIHDYHKPWQSVCLCVYVCMSVYAVYNIHQYWCTQLGKSSSTHVPLCLWRAFCSCTEKWKFLSKSTEGVTCIGLQASGGSKHVETHIILFCLQAVNRGTNVLSYIWIKNTMTSGGHLSDLRKELFSSTTKSLISSLTDRQVRLAGGPGSPGGEMSCVDDLKTTLLWWCGSAFASRQQGWAVCPCCLGIDSRDGL